MLRKPVKTERLVKTLEQLGFVASSSEAGHTIFRHAKTGLVVTLPTNLDEIPLVYLRSIELQIGNFNIVPDEKLQRLLYSSHPS
jgi:predicted RNA binding protein YcfA (HicA-like mRNA interferase family)